MNRTLTRAVLGLAAVLALAAAPAFTATAASAATAWNSGYTCTGGNVAPGYYPSVTIGGLCSMNYGTVTIGGNLDVRPGALLDAGADPQDPSVSQAVVTATVHVGGNVYVGKGAVLVLGCSPNLLGICPNGETFDTIGGNLTAKGALGTVVHDTAIQGNVYVQGGGGGVTCTPEAPWSEDKSLTAAQVPQYTDFEDGSVGGNFAVVNVQTCWDGTLREQIGGNVDFSGNSDADPDGMEILNNLVGGSMGCYGNSPAIQFGDSSAAPNIVGGNASGECGFGVRQPNPAAEADEGTGVQMPIAVPAWSLPTYFGKHTATPVTSLPKVTTDSGYVITADLNDFTLTGYGLAGSGTFSPSLGPGVSGDGVLTVTRQDGYGHFIAYDACDSCSLGGQSGTVLLRFYGTVLPNGVTYGTFLVTSGGSYPVIPGLPTGALATLAGWGTFTSAGQASGTWKLIEHLRITT